MARWIALLLALFAWGHATSAPVSASVPKAVCFAGSTPEEPLRALAADTSRFSCEPAAASIAPERSVLRMAVQPDSLAPRFFTTRPALFGALTLAMVREGRIVARQSYPAAELYGGTSVNHFVVPLPAATGRVDAVIVAIDGATSPGLLSDAAIHVSDPSRQSRAITNLLFAALVCGVLLMPLAFNAAFFRVLKERFLLWHMAVSLGLLAQCLLTSGVIGNFVDIPVRLYSQLVILTLGISVAAAASFAATFIEADKLDPRLRKALHICALQVMIASVLHTVFSGVLRGVQIQVYYASFVPVMVIFAFAMFDAMRRGSRSVRFQLVAWSPFILMGVIRIGTMLVPGIPQDEAMGLFYVAMVVQAVATSLGVADRFMLIKRQRDRAILDASSLAKLSERDDLTGLYNRRVLDGSLGDLSGQGFTGFAVFDLDNFKRVNDTHGHTLGDRVLTVAASVFRSEENSVAIRMGGEEFLLLLRGDNVAQRVERVREAIPVRIAREVAEMEMLVTSSAGLIETRGGQPHWLSFHELYRLADELLYEAKFSGRNLLAARVLSPPQESIAAVVA